MFQRVFVTLAAFFLIGAASGPNPHTVDVTVSHALNLRSSHVFLGVAVLGHHVGRIEAGWLVKQADRGWLHIDWRKAGKWDGLTRTEQGPRDVSAAQLDQVLRTIEGLGFSQTAIRAWRVAAPVGYDGFGEGDQVLTIGEILVDLGPVDQARVALERWWNAVDKDDPFEKIPHTNVEYSDTLYFQPDCQAEAQAFHDAVLAQAQQIATAAASAAHTSATLTNYSSSTTDTLLCPQDREPHFMRTSGGPPIGIQNFELSVWQRGEVTYTLAGRPSGSAVPPAADDLSATTQSYEFNLPEAYAATIGSASVRVKPDAMVLHFIYDLGTKDRAGYAADAQMVQARLDRLRAAVTDPNDVLIQRSPPEARTDAVDAFVVVRQPDAQTVNRIAQAGQSAESSDSIRYTAYLANCDTAVQTAVRRALADSRRKAQTFARLMHATIRDLGAARVDDGLDGNSLCGFDPHASAATLAARISWNNSAPLNGVHDISIEPTVDAAWMLAGVARPAVPLVRTEYEAQVRGASAVDALDLQALTRAAREAIVDDPHIVSVYEAEPFIDSDSHGTNSASERIIVLRKP